MMSLRRRCLNAFVLACYLNLLISSAWAGNSIFETPDYTVKVQRIPSSSKDVPEGFRLRLKQNDSIPGKEASISSVLLDEVMPFPSEKGFSNSKTFEEVLDDQKRSLGFSWVLPNLLTLTIGWDGQILVRKSENSHKTLKLSTTENVFLSDLSLKGLRVKAHFVDIGKNTHIKETAFELLTPTSLVRVHSEGEFQVEQMHLLKGMFLNHGTIISSKSQHFHLHENIFLNAGNITSPEETLLEKVGTFQNLGLIQSPKLSVNGSYLENNGDLKGNHVSLTAFKGLENNGVIQSAEESRLVSLNLLRNHGTLQGDKNQSVLVQGNLINEGTIKASQNSVKVWNHLENKGSLEGEKTSLQAQTLTSSDKSTLKGTQALDLEVQEGTLKGEIEAKELKISSTKDVTNEAHLRTSHLSLNIKEGARFINQKNLEVDTLTTEGQGGVLNSHHIFLKQAASLQNGRFENLGTLSQKKGENQEVKIQGTHFINNGLVDLEQVRLDTSSKANLYNWGIFQVQKDLLGQNLGTFENTGLIQSIKGDLHLGLEKFRGTRGKGGALKAQGSVTLRQTGDHLMNVSFKMLGAQEGQVDLFLPHTQVGIEESLKAQGSSLKTRSLMITGDVLLSGDNQWEMKGLKLGETPQTLQINNLNLKTDYLKTGSSREHKILLTGHSEIKAEEAYGASPLESPGSLKVEAKTLFMPVIRAEKSLSLKAKRLPYQDYEYVSNGKLDLDRGDQVLFNRGHLQAPELDLKAQAIVNEKTLLGLKSTTLKTAAGFKNSEGAEASLGQLTWINKGGKSPSLINQGQLTVDKIVEMTGIEHLKNGTHDTDKPALLKVKEGEFKVQSLTNGGKLDLGRGTYTLGEFVNTAKGVFTLGLHNYVTSFLNEGLWLSSGRVNIKDGTFLKKLGKISIGGELKCDFKEGVPTAQLFKEAEIHSQKVTVRQGQFLGTHSFQFDMPLYFLTNSFHNLADIKAPFIQVMTKSFIQGKEGVYGSLFSTGPKGLVRIEAETVDNRWGKIFGKQEVTLKATQGDLQNGAPTRGTTFDYARNEAFISSDGILDLEASQGNLFNDYGTLFSRKFLTLKAQNMIRNKAGIIWGQTGGFFKAKRLEMTREDQRGVSHTKEVHHPRFGRWYSGGGGSYVTHEPYTLYTEQSDAAEVDISNEFGEGNLILDVLELLLLASKLNISGNLVAQGQNIDPSQALPGFFTVQAREDTERGTSYPATLKVRENIQIDSGKVVFQGGVSGFNIGVNAQNFFAENITNEKSQRSQGTKVYDLIDLAGQYTTSGGLFKDNGENGPGPRYGFSVPIFEPEERYSLRNLTLIGGSSSEQALMGSLIMTPLFIEWCVRKIATEICGRMALNSEVYINQLLKNAKDKKDHLKTWDDVYKETESMLIFEIQTVGKTLNELNQAPTLIPHLVISEKDQHPEENDSGHVEAEKDLTAKAEENIILKSAHVEADHLNLYAEDRLNLIRKKYTIVTPITDGVKIEEFAAPPMTLIGRLSTSALGKKEYYAEGIQAFSGKEGGTYGSTEGDATTVPQVLNTTIRTERKEDGGIFGTDKIHRTESHSQTLNGSVYISEGNLTHRAGKDKTLHMTATKNIVAEDPKNVLTFEAKTVQVEAGVAHHSFSETVEKQGVFQESHFSSGNNSVSYTSSENHAPTMRVIAENSTMTGTLNNVRKVEDHVRDTFKIGMQKEEVHSFTSQSRTSFTGGSYRDHHVTQDVGCPSVLNVDYWETSFGKNLIFESVLGKKIGQFIVKGKDFKMETASLKRTETLQEGSYGFSAPGLGQPLFQDSFVNAAQGMGSAEAPMDQIAANLKMANESASLLLDAARLCAGDPTVLLDRYVSFTFHHHEARSKTLQTEAQPNIINAKTMFFQNDHTHLEGQIETQDLYVLSKKLTGSAMKNTLYHEAESRDQSATWGLGSFAPSVSVSTSSEKVEQTSHQNTTLKAHNVFIRVDDWLFNGVNLQAKLVDAVVNKTLTLESVLDWFQSEATSTSVSLGGKQLPDVRHANRNEVKAHIEKMASLIGTEQFYLKVGEHMVARSAEFGLKAEENKRLSVTTEYNEVKTDHPLYRQVEEKMTPEKEKISSVKQAFTREQLKEKLIQGLLNDTFTIKTVFDWFEAKNEYGETGPASKMILGEELEKISTLPAEALLSIYPEAIQELLDLLEKVLGPRTFYFGISQHLMKHWVKKPLKQVTVQMGDWVFSDQTLKTKLIEGMVKGYFSVGKVVKWFQPDGDLIKKPLDIPQFTKIGYSTSPDFFKAQIEKLCEVVGEELFYKKVVQNLLSYAEKLNLKPDGAKVASWSTEEGKTYYRRPMPPVDSGFHGLLTSYGFANPKEEAVKRLLEASGREDIRTLLGFKDEKAYKAAVSDPGFELSMGGLKALAALFQIEVELYTLDPHTKKLKLQEAFTPADAKETVRLLEQETGKIDRLEDSTSKMDIKKLVEEKLHEFEHRDDVVINLPMGTAMSLASKLPEIRNLIRDTYQKLTEEKGVSPEKAVDQTTALEKAYNAMREQGATKEQAMEVLSNSEIKKLIQNGATFNPELIHKQNQKAEKKHADQSVKQGSPHQPVKHDKDGGLRVTIDEGKLPSPLDQAIDLTKKGALYLNTYAEKHPHLAKFAATAVEIGLGGPVRYVVRETVTSVAGDRIEKAKQTATDFVVKKLNYPEEWVETTKTVVDFGIGLVTNKAKGTLKDAKSVAEAVKKQEAKWAPKVKTQPSKRHNTSAPGASRSKKAPSAPSNSQKPESLDKAFSRAMNHPSFLKNPARMKPEVGKKGDQRVSMTYTKTHKETGQVYTGRTSGKGNINDPKSLEKIVSKRDKNHHMNEKGFGKAKLDKASTNSHAVRGREQIRIDQTGGAQKQGGTSGNIINGIRDKNPKRDMYIDAAKKEFKD